VRIVDQEKGDIGAADACDRLGERLDKGIWLRRLVRQ
jgi:hypothetical protein